MSRTRSSFAPMSAVLRPYVMRTLILLSLLLLSCVSHAEITLDIPEKWTLSGVELYESDKKVGELISQESWPYSSGADFIQSFERGFVDDPGSTSFEVSGRSDEVFWVCRASEYEGADGEHGIWYSRYFWVGGPILVIYSYESCNYELDIAIELARSLLESNR